MEDTIIEKIKRKFRINFRKIQAEVQNRAFSWALTSPRRSSYYYAFFNTRFDREHFSVLHGKNNHLRLVEGTISTETMLRRNIHRLEKGFTTIPQKPTFAEGYILETVKAYCNSVKAAKDYNSLKWSHDVLASYFENVVKTEKIRIAEKEFLKCEKIFENSDKEKKYIPYERRQSVFSNVSYETFLSLCAQRRSVRWYKKDPVPLELVKKAITAALFSPSACNRQPFRFIVVEDPERLKTVSRFPAGTDTFAHNIPMMVALVGDLSAYFEERDRHIIYIDGGLASMSFMFALETLGLASCPVNWPDIEEREKAFSEYFNLPPHERCIMFISIGYAMDEGKIAYSQKKSVENLVQIH